MAMTFRILRYDPLRDTGPYFQDFAHEPKPMDSVLETLKDIRDRQDPSLSFRYSCREAVCGACAMVINGRIGLACRTMVASLPAGVCVVEPLPSLEIQKDLVVDLEPFWEAYRHLQPFLQPAGEAPPQGHRVKEKEMESVFQYIPCILCACCYSACPVAARDRNYLGPAALAKLHRLVEDPRDRRPDKVLALADASSGAWGCQNVYRCNDVCPKDVRPADGIRGVRWALIGQRTRRLFRRKR